MQNIESWVAVLFLSSDMFAIFLSFSQLVSRGVNVPFIPALFLSRWLAKKTSFASARFFLIQGIVDRLSPFSDGKKIVKGKELILF